MTTALSKRLWLWLWFGVAWFGLVGAYLCVRNVHLPVHIVQQRRNIVKEIELAGRDGRIVLGLNSVAGRHGGRGGGARRGAGSQHARGALGLGGRRLSALAERIERVAGSLLQRLELRGNLDRCQY